MIACRASKSLVKFPRTRGEKDRADREESEGQRFRAILRLSFKRCRCQRTFDETGTIYQASIILDFTLGQRGSGRGPTEVGRQSLLEITVPSSLPPSLRLSQGSAIPTQLSAARANSPIRPIGARARDRRAGPSSSAPASGGVVVVVVVVVVMVGLTEGDPRGARA